VRKKSRYSGSGSRGNKSRSTVRRRRSGLRFYSGLGRYIVPGLAVFLFFRYVAAPLGVRIKAHPVFTVRRVTVEGADYLDEKKIVEKAGVPEGVNIFTVDVAGVSETLKRSFTAEDFVVFRRLPDTITIRVKERVPVALLNSRKLVGVDREGVPLPHIGAAMAESLPIITGVGDIASLSDSVARKRLVKGLRLLDRISKESPSVYNRISELNVSNLSEMGITLIDSGLEVIIGESDWERKIPILENVIEKFTAGGNAVKAVDIRFAERVFVRKR